MQIELTEEQYRLLIELVYMGNWVANATRDQREVRKEYEEMEQHILSYYRDFHAEDAIEFDEEMKEYFPTRQLEDKVQAMIDEYDDDSFWETLAERLAERDVMEEVGPVAAFTTEMHERLWDIMAEYAEEFEKYGLRRLRIVPNSTRSRKKSSPDR